MSLCGNRINFRRSVSDVTKPHHDDYFLLRWLRARSWDAEASEKMLRESLNWRKAWDVDEGIKSWEPPEALGLYYPSGTTGFDNNGCPVIIVPFSGLDIVGVLHSASRQDMVRLTIKILEKNLEMAAEGGGNQVVVVFDMDGWNIRPYAWRPAAEVVISLIQMYEANYPEILKACYIINAPRVFAIAFSVVKQFLNEYTLGKIQILKADRSKCEKLLKENIPLDVLPKHYGGNMVDPDGDPKCSSKVRQGGKVPKSYYTQTFGKNGENGDKNQEQQFKTTLVKKGKKFTLDFMVLDEGCTLKWEFRTEDHDIRFGITRVDEEGQATPSVRFRRVASNQLNEAGVIMCEAPATYTVTFDNSYSILRHKKLHYNVSLSKPLDRFTIDDLADSLPDDVLQTDIEVGDDVVSERL